MVFANVGTLGVVPGERDALVAHLTRRSDVLAQIGCLAYEVGVNDEQPDTVFVVELWESAEAHRASLDLPDVQQSIAVARPLLTGEFGGFRFDVVGSPLRSTSRTASEFLALRKGRPPVDEDFARDATNIGAPRD